MARSHDELVQQFLKILKVYFVQFGYKQPKVTYKHNHDGRTVFTVKEDISYLFDGDESVIVQDNYIVSMNAGDNINQVHGKAYSVALQHHRKIFKRIQKVLKGTSVAAG